MFGFRQNPVYLKALTTNFNNVVRSSTQAVKLIPAVIINSCLMKVISRTVGLQCNYQGIK